MSDDERHVRVLSGIQPTSDSFHLGNYLGAIRPALALASDGAGGVLLAWGVRIGGERDGAAPLERRAVWLRDGLTVPTGTRSRAV